MNTLIILNSPYDGQYDDLLYYFAYQYEVVQQAMVERDTTAVAAARKRLADDGERDLDLPQCRKKHPKTN